MLLPFHLVFVGFLDMMESIAFAKFFWTYFSAIQYFFKTFLFFYVHLESIPLKSRKMSGEIPDVSRDDEYCFLEST